VVFCILDRLMTGYLLYSIKLPEVDLREELSPPAGQNERILKGDPSGFLHRHNT
jgi:hypothetical protein